MCTATCRPERSPLRAILLPTFPKVQVPKVYLLFSPTVCTPHSTPHTLHSNIHSHFTAFAAHKTHLKSLDTLHLALRTLLLQVALTAATCGYLGCCPSPCLGVSWLSSLFVPYPWPSSPGRIVFVLAVSAVSAVSSHIFFLFEILGVPAMVRSRAQLVWSLQPG